MSEMTQLEVRGTDPEVDDDPVRDVQRNFPHYRIWCEMAVAREPRYVAQARTLGARLHIVMTPDLGELRRALEKASAHLISDSGRVMCRADEACCPGSEDGAFASPQGGRPHRLMRRSLARPRMPR